MGVFLTQAFNGLSVGSVLLLIALGLAFTFGLMRVINMAHGELIMAGAYTGYVLQSVGMGAGLSLLVALPVAFCMAGVIGLALERLLVRRLYGRPLDTLLATWGVGLVLQQAARDIFGAPNVQVVAPEWLSGGLTVAGLTLPYKRLFIMGLVGVCTAGIGVYLYRTVAGRRLRAVMQDREAAAAIGVRTPAVDALTFFIGSGLAGVAGVALSLIGPIGPSIGTFYIVDAFLVVIVGGLGRLSGAVGAALLLGLANATFEWRTTASIAKVLVFLLVIAFLQVRPSGLVGSTVRVVTE